MPLKELREKYAASNAKTAINRAIRAECAGGDAALDGLTLVKQMLDRHGWEDDQGNPNELQIAFRALPAVVDQMEDAVRERWGLPAREERDDLAR